MGQWIAPIVLNSNGAIMRKEKRIYLLKVFCVFAILLLVFAYIFNFVIQITMPQTSTTGNSLLSVGHYIVCLMAISVLAQKIALSLIKKPEIF